MDSTHSHLTMLLGVIVFSLVALVHERSNDTHTRRIRLVSLVLLGLLALTIAAVVLGQPHQS